jgi:DNA-binding NtrC family response regulator
VDDSNLDNHDPLAQRTLDEPLAPLARRPRLGTAPEEVGVSVRLDRPFHELKQQIMQEFERAYVRYCLEESAMNVSQASRLSGLSRKHLRTLMVKYGVVVRRELVVDDPDR